MIAFDAAICRIGAFALGPIQLHIAPGECVWILGPSGAGKSSLLSAIAGFLPLAGGALRLRGVDARTLRPQQRRCGWVPQAPILFPHMSVADNIAYGLRCRGASSAACTARVRALAIRLELEPLLARRPAALSGGESQRVALARALAAECDTLLLDEPFSALDRRGRRDLQRLVDTLQRELGLTVLHVTHHLDDLRADAGRGIAAADRAITLVAGRITHDGSLAHVMAQLSDDTSA